MCAVNKDAKNGQIKKFRGIMKPINNCYIAKSRMYNVSLKGLSIYNVNFKGSIITQSSFKKTIITDCEFLGTNLSRCNFSNAIIKNSVFLGAKLTGTNFKGAIFENVIFVTQRLSECKNLSFSYENNKVIKQIEKIDLSEELKKQVDVYHNLSKDKITHILKLKNSKYSFLHISILLSSFTQEQLCYALNKIIKFKNFDIPTIFAFEKACKKYLNML